MRLVLDTNVLIAALIARGACSDLLEHCALRHTLVTSDAIMRELHDQLVEKFKYAVQEADEAVSLLRSQMEPVTPATLDRPVCRDADDDQILATALAGHAQCIVTGDKDLLVLQRYAGIEISSPSDSTDFEAKSQ
jgi:putative PIN family toxin of toxin-antitoxin system